MIALDICGCVLACILLEASLGIGSDQLEGHTVGVSRPKQEILCDSRHKLAESSGLFSSRGLREKKGRGSVRMGRLVLQD